MTDPHAVGLRAPAHVPLQQARDAVRALRDAAARLGYRVHGALADEPAPHREHQRHREHLARLTERHGDIAVFARNLAAYLPGAWSVNVPPMDTMFRQLDVTDRIWDEGHLYWIASELVIDRAATLTGPGGIELVVVDRPYGKGPFMVGALLPDGLGRLPFHTPPNAISVPADAARAAERVVLRLLPAYRRALAEITPAVARPTPASPAVAAPPTTSRTR